MSYFTLSLFQILRNRSNNIHFRCSLQWYRLHSLLLWYLQPELGVSLEASAHEFLPIALRRWWVFKRWVRVERRILCSLYLCWRSSWKRRDHWNGKGVKKSTWKWVWSIISTLGDLFLRYDPSAEERNLQGILQRELGVSIWRSLWWE